jgi:hypothetical protein
MLAVFTVYKEKLKNCFYNQFRELRVRETKVKDMEM